LARCGCGGAQCGCAVVAGDNTQISGTGSAANSFVIIAETSCPGIRARLHGTAGVAYDEASGTFSVVLSGQAGSNLTVNGDGGLFVPTAGAMVSTGCGLTGDGSGSAPGHGQRPGMAVRVLPRRRRRRRALRQHRRAASIASTAASASPPLSVRAWRRTTPTSW